MKDDELKKKLVRRSSLSGSIFAVTGEEVEEKTHWKRKLVIRLYPLILLLTDIVLVWLVFAVAIYLYSDVEILHSLSRRVLLAIMLPSIIGVYLIGGYNYATDKRKVRFVSEHIIASVGVSIVGFLCYLFDRFLRS